jgi:hypothetical protein
MNYIYHQQGDSGFVEGLPGDGVVQSEEEALELVAACGEYGTFNLLLPAECLADEFFNLSSGVAGAVFLKLSLYRIRCAILLPPEQATQGRFGEMVLEANRRDDALHFFSDRSKALDWLMG